MAREEAIVGEGCVDTPARQAAAKTCIERVDDLLKLETRRYFENSVPRTRIEGGPSCFKSRLEEATPSIEDLERKTRALRVEGRAGGLAKRKTENDFAAQERLERRKAAEAWRETARFDLREAFAHAVRAGRRRVGGLRTSTPVRCGRKTR